MAFGIAVAWLLAWLVMQVFLRLPLSPNPLFGVFYFVYASTPVSLPIISILGALYGYITAGSVQKPRTWAIFGYLLLPVFGAILLIPYIFEYNRFVSGW